MTFLGLEQPVAYGRELVFDPTTALMVLNANRDYINAVYRDYQLAMADMKEFNKEYGNFLSPFARDMERYNQIVGGIQNGIEDLYNRGIDPLRSSEGRAYVTRMINSVNPAELAAMKSNAKLGYAYLDAMQALRKAGKYSQAQEDFDIALNGETAFNDFATGNGSGGFNTWGRTSPIEATTLRDLTYDSYKGRTARDLTREDFRNDPRLSKYAYDPRYQYSGYLDSDLMKVAPGASASLAADPRAAFFRDQARQKVIASGKEPTAEAVEAQFQRDIADANTWALIDPTKRADDFAKMDLSYRQQAALQAQQHKDKMDEIAEAGKYKGGGNGDETSGSYANVVSNTTSAIYKSIIEETMTSNQFKEAQRIQTIKNPIERKAAEDKLLSNVFKTWLIKKRPGGSVFKRLMEVEEGERGRQELNRILDSRTVSGNTRLDNDVILGGDLEKDGNGWFDITGSDYRVLSSHQLMKNIIENEAKSGFTITDVNGKKWSKQDIIDHLDKTGDDFLNSWWSTEADIAKRAEKIKPAKSKKRYLASYDESGKRHVYMKVLVDYDVNWFPFNGKAEDMWVELPIDQLPIGTTTTESAPYLYGSELIERKEFSNAAVNSTYGNVRW